MSSEKTLNWYDSVTHSVTNRGRPGRRKLYVSTVITAFYHNFTLLFFLFCCIMHSNGQIRPKRRMSFPINYYIPFC